MHASKTNLIFVQLTKSQFQQHSIIHLRDPAALGKLLAPIEAFNATDDIWF